LGRIVMFYVIGVRAPSFFDNCLHVLFCFNDYFFEKQGQR
jgi:hypothetical protein